MYRGGQLRDISEVSEVGVTIIQQFRHLGPFTQPLSSSPSVDHGELMLQDRDASKTTAMKEYPDSWRYVKEHGMNIEDMVLVPNKKRNKFSTLYRNEKYYVVRVKGSMITAENERGARITRDSSKFKDVNIQGKNKTQVRDFDWSDEEKEKPPTTTGEPELPQGQAAQSQTQAATQLKISTRQRISTRDTICKYFTSA